MKNYIVGIKEISLQHVEIEAEDEKDAILRVQDGEGNYLDTPETLETLDSEEWSVKLNVMQSK